MKLPPEKVDAWVRAHFDVKERKGGEILCIANPLINDSKKHLGISIEDQWVHDFRGDALWLGYDRNGLPNKRSFLKFVQLYKNCSFSEAISEVLGSPSDARSVLAQYRRSNAREVKGKASVSLPDGTRRLSSSQPTKAALAVLNWLSRRGVNDALVKKHNIMHCGLDAVWPYYEYDEDVVYWQSRSILQKRYLFPDDSVGVTKGQFLYAFDHTEPASYIILTEAVFGAITLGEQSLAIGGASLAPPQVGKIRLLNPRQGIILAPDNDAPGINSILENSSLLKSTGYRVFYALPPLIPCVKNGETHLTKDWNELYTDAGMGLPAIRKVFEESVKPLTLQARISLRKEIDAANIRRRARVVNQPS